jgi:hypothetical protein
MAVLRPNSDEDPRAVRPAAIQSALRQGIPDMDAEDLADRAIEKAMRDSNNPAIPLERRVGQALRDERADYFRRQYARPRIATDEVPDVPADDGEPGSCIELIDACLEIRERFGQDELEYIFMRVAGFAEREIGKQPGWDPMRAARVRRRLARHGRDILSNIFNIDLMPDDHEEAS